MQLLLRLVLLVAIAPIIFLQGCDSTSNETLPNNGQTLCLDLYQMCIDPIMHNPTTTNPVNITCSQAGCHNLPGRTPAQGFGLTPGAVNGSVEMMANFFGVEARTLNSNLLLTRATGVGHPTGGPRINVGSVCYDAISEWRSINAPTDGSACAVPPNCALIAAAPVLNVANCGP